MRVLSACLCALVAACSSSAGQERPDSPSAALSELLPVTAPELFAVVADVVWMTPEGRPAGSTAERAVAEYLVRELVAAGFEPAAHSGFLQDVPLRRGRSVNVVGVLPGSDPDLAEQHLVLGAHIDHLGTDRSGAVYPGADDNGSGVAALVGIARAWQRSGYRPRRSIVIVGFGAEELGLRGAEHYVRHPARPLDEAIAMINLDMLGRERFYDRSSLAVVKSLAGISAGPGIGILHTGSPRLLDLARCAARSSGVAPYAPEDYPRLRKMIEAKATNRSDSAPFNRRGVPTLFYSTSEHDDYHRPTDTLDKIDWLALRRNTELVWRTILAVDSTDQLEQLELSCPSP